MEGENLSELVKRQAKIISEQAEIIKKLEARIVELETPVRKQQETITRPRKDSHTSSKSLSSDIVKPKPQPTNGGKKRKIDGQRGHKKHERMPFPPDQVDRFIEVTLETCPCCGGPLHECEEVVTKRRIDIVEKLFIVTKYHCHTYTCLGCETAPTASEPEESLGGLFSVGLIVAYLKCGIMYHTEH